METIKTLFLVQLGITAIAFAIAWGVSWSEKRKASPPGSSQANAVLALIAFGSIAVGWAAWVIALVAVWLLG